VDGDHARGFGEIAAVRQEANHRATSHSFERFASE
jgi:hypothetical protein